MEWQNWKIYIPYLFLRKQNEIRNIQVQILFFLNWSYVEEKCCQETTVDIENVITNKNSQSTEYL